jgi:hypothetical protein
VLNFSILALLENIIENWTDKVSDKFFKSQNSQNFLELTFKFIYIVKIYGQFSPNLKSSQMFRLEAKR